MVIVCRNVEKFMPATGALPANNNGVPYHRARGTQTQLMDAIIIIV